MAIHQVVYVISMRHTLMTASCSVNVVGLMSAAIMLRRAFVGVVFSHANRMIVYVVTVNVVHVSIMKIIRVAVMLNSGVTAIRTVGVRMAFVFRTTLRTHHCLQYVSSDKTRIRLTDYVMPVNLL
jgi:hypothetical protein